MNEPKVSIIVPVYKVEQYIEKCIQSILGQSYRNFELILIDDGSPDSSGSICDRYAAEDSRVRVVHKQNEGVSVARNTGLDIATGDYITFIDSDDYVSEYYLKHLLTAIVSGNVDLVVEGYMRVYADRADILTYPQIKCVPQQYSLLFSECGLQKNCSPWGKLFRRSVIVAHGLRFTPKVHLGEDIIFVLNYISYTKGIAVINETDYYYVQREGSLAKRLNSVDSEIEGYLQFCTSVEMLKQRCGLDEESLCLLYRGSTHLLDRCKVAISRIADSRQRMNSFKRMDWMPLLRYKRFNSWRERLLDSLVAYRMFRLYMWLTYVKS